MIESEKMRHALLDDIDFVLNLVREGARDGHYAPWMQEPAHLHALRAALKQVIQHGGMARQTERGTEIVKAVLVIYEASDHGRVAFLLAAEKVPGSEETDVELYKCSVARPFRGRGIGARLIAAFVSRYPKQVRFFARCYPKSTFMIAILRSVGFHQIGTTSGGTLVLERPTGAPWPCAQADRGIMP